MLNMRTVIDSIKCIKEMNVIEDKAQIAAAFLVKQVCLLLQTSDNRVL